MNTLKIESKLADKYWYRPLPKDLSIKYRNLFRKNIPNFLDINGCEDKLYTLKGTLICNGYKRIVIGDYGAFIEFDKNQANYSHFKEQIGQEYRNEQKYNNVKYIWMTIYDESNIKIYYQRRTVKYADYLKGMFYVSVHEVKNGQL